MASEHGFKESNKKVYVNLKLIPNKLNQNGRTGATKEKDIKI